MSPDRGISSLAAGRRRELDRGTEDLVRYPGDELSQLLDVVEEGKHALHEQLRGTFVVVGQAVVGE